MVTGSVWRKGRSERSRENYRIRRAPTSKSSDPRAGETYRSDRRNHSVLNRDKKDWYGVETKPGKAPPPMVLKTSQRGETHYEPLW